MYHILEMGEKYVIPRIQFIVVKGNKSSHEATATVSGGVTADTAPCNCGLAVVYKVSHYLLFLFKLIMRVEMGKRLPPPLMPFRRGL